MSKLEKKVKKNIIKLKEQEKKEYPLKNKIFNFTKILYLILIIAIVVCAITIISNGSYKLNSGLSKLDSSNIVVGQTFTRSQEEYYVVFYFEDDLVNIIDKISDSKIYKVNLNSGLNKNVISESSNSYASNASELKIKETTMIKISNKKNIQYIEGYDSVKEMLNNL